MNVDPENFDALQKLLKLKRYEQPPPGYFNHFSTQVIARIKAGELGESASILERLFGEASLWHRWGVAFQSRPGFAGAFGAAVCALLVSGIVYSENAPAPNTQTLLPDVTAPMAAIAANEVYFEQSEMGYSTNPLAPPTESLFDNFALPQVQQVNFAFPAGR